MANAINYAERYGNQLDQMIQQGILTAGLETQNVDWVGAKSFHVPSLTVSGYQPHTRNKGYNEGSVSTTDNIYTLGFDRDIEFFVDKADVDESNQAASAANITRVFTTEHAIPEIDAYRFSKLAQYATGDNKKSEVLTKDNVFTSLKEALKPLRKYGPGNVTCYVSSDVMTALEESSEFTRTIDARTLGGYDTRATSIDGVPLIEVWDDRRFYDTFDFTDGFTPANDAKQLNYLAVVRPAVIAKAKINSVYLFAPGQHTEGDGYLYQNRLYHDLFMLKNKQDGVVASTVSSGS